MDAEILFFMTEKDQAGFLELASNSCDSMSTLELNIVQLHIGGCYLSFVPSTFKNGILYTGRLEIRMSNFSSSIDLRHKERAKAVFRKLRNWIKKYYWSRLAYKNHHKKGKLTPSRNHWLGPDARRWKEADKDHVLKLSVTSWMVFDIGY